MFPRQSDITCFRSFSMIHIRWYRLTYQQHAELSMCLNITIQMVPSPVTFWRQTVSILSVWSRVPVLYPGMQELRHLSSTLSVDPYPVSITHEPQHDKTNKMKTRISLRICPVWSGSSLSTWRSPWLSLERTAKTMIRLSGCPGWSVFAGRMSFCWFCHAQAHMKLPKNLILS